MNKISILFAFEPARSNPAMMFRRRCSFIRPEEASATPEPAGYYEYLWCKNGENASDEAIASLVADWNAEIDKPTQCRFRLHPTRLE